ncbi:prickle-like protein 1 [Argiope bruennichi]|uniref:Prickle planar cell polarity protein 3 like protein n=1 Tax=Argiope bruennichi TaxID=94029 RepID=A0A8T0FQ18_ARGBR|nr:prickle-like protein 1 [Argiope bruennichi]KAF8793287.1 Prickle planar cell polarity protein 3 like protein [Argiope bruennichi]
MSANTDESEDTPACESFRLHPRRKVCKECKQPRERHPLSEEDIKQLHNLVTSLAHDCEAEDPKSNSVYAWIPPQCPEERLDDYFSCFRDDEVPKHNSEGLQWHLKTLMKQIPETDVSPSACRFVEPENFPDLEEFIENIRKKTMYFGYVQPRTEKMPMQCPTCLILLEVDELVVVPALQSSLAYHPACFICSTCREHLVDLVHCFEVDGKIYCVRHYSDALRKRCHACDELIFSVQYSQAGEAFYHTDHLRCFHCDDPLEDNKGFAKDGELYCMTCYEDMYGDDCQKCGQRIPLETKQISFDGRKFHINCFKCSDCQNVIGTGTFHTHGDFPYCFECYRRNFGVRCFKCRYAITDDDAVMYNKQPYHDECFTCHRCQARLAEQTFKNVDDDLYCVNCYGETFCKRCHSCGQPILIGDNDVLYSYGEFKWHAECFICRVCQRSLADTPFIMQGNVLICQGCTSQEDTLSGASTTRGRKDRRPTERLSGSSRRAPASREDTPSSESTSRDKEDRRPTERLSNNSKERASTNQEDTHSGASTSRGSKNSKGKVPENKSNSKNRKKQSKKSNEKNPKKN